MNLRVLAWAVFDVGVTVFSMVVISRYGAIWAIDQLGASNPAYNVTVSLSMLLAGIIQVLLSPVSDEWGRRRIFVILFICLCAAACAAMSSAKATLTGLLFFSLANIGYQASYAFYNAMLSDVADEKHKARISGVGIGLGYTGAIIGLILSSRFVNTNLHEYSRVFLPTACMVLFFSLPLVLFVKEKPGLVRFNFADSLRNSPGSFLTTLRRVARHKELLFFFIGLLLVLDGVETVIINMSIYCEKVVGMDIQRGFHLTPMWKDRVLFDHTLSEIDAFLITSTLFAMIGAPLVGHIADKTTRFKTLLGVVILWICALVLAMFSVQRKLFWLTGPLFGIGFGSIWTMGRAYLLELCHPEERAQMFSLFSLVGKGAAVLGPLVWGTVFALCKNGLGMGERKAYRFAIAAILMLVVAGFAVLRRAKPAEPEG
ncbi:MAG: MFS transporter [Verrucomicrobiae bacterium]|nr:MFS transporter [Verrucomicrobiae bacterium]